MLRIEIIRSASSLHSLRSAWQALYDPARHSIFQSPEWNLLAARVFEGRAPIMAVHAESDAGAAIIPACASDGRVCFLGDELFDYRDVLAAGDPEILRRAWQQVAATRLPLSITALRGDAARERWETVGFAPAQFCQAPGVRGMPADEFAARHTRSARFLRRLARSGVEFRVHGGSDATLVQHIYESKAKQPASPQNLFADSRRVEFVTAVAAQDRRCEIFTLETAGTLVAALITYREDSIRRFYTTYYDQGWAHESPGIAILMEVTRRSLEQGLDCDYMTGEQPHKARFATGGTPLFRVEAQAEELARISGFRPPVEGEHYPVQIAA